jgi:hypothetical protein
VLDESRVTYAELPVLTVRMNNVPGAGAEMLRKLADAEIRLDLCCRC